jgi:hypothetical protein
MIACPEIANEIKQCLSKEMGASQTNCLQRNQGIYKALGGSKHVNGTIRRI